MMHYKFDNAPRSHGCGSRALTIDIYKQPIRLQTPDQKDTYRTMAGAIFSCITLMAVASYAAFKLNQLITLQEYNVQERN